MRIPGKPVAAVTVGILGSLLTLFVASLWIRGSAFQFDIFDTSHWDYLGAHFSAVYDGRADLAWGLLGMIAGTALLTPLVGLAAAYLVAGPLYLVFTAPFRLVLALASTVWAVIYNLLPYQITPKRPRRPRVVFDNDDDLGYVSSAPDHVPDDNNEDDDTPPPVDTTLPSQPARPPRLVTPPAREPQTRDSRAPEPKATPRPQVEPTTPPAEDNHVAGGRTGDPLVDLWGKLAPTDDEDTDLADTAQTAIVANGDPTGDASEADSAQAEDRDRLIKPAQPFDQVRALLRDYLDRNGWTVMTDIWVDASRSVGPDFPIDPVGHIPIVALSSQALFCFFLVDLEGQAWTGFDDPDGSTEEPAPWRTQTEDGSDRTRPSPINEAHDNLNRLTTHYLRYPDIIALDARAVILVFNGTLQNAEDVDAAWTKYSELRACLLEDGDLEDNSLDEVLAEQLGERLSIEDMPLDSHVATIRNQSAETARLHNKAA